MKTKLHSNLLYLILTVFLCFNYGNSQNLMLNPTCDTHGTGSGSTGDNADAYDMTPNNTILDESGMEITSPYQPIWDNDDLEDWLEQFYLGMAGTLDEQPGSTSGGNNGTRGVKLYDDGSPVITGSSRRIYQKVEGLTIGVDYTFTVESRAEASNVSEIYILNTEITDEVGLNDNGAADASVDGFTNSPATEDVWETNTITFTATNTFAVVYIRSLGSIDEETEVFYDNFSLVDSASLSLEEDVLSSNISIYPNPAKTSITIKTSNQTEITGVEMYNILGKKVISQTLSSSNKLDVSTLSTGVYLLKITSNDASVVKRVVIE